MKKKIHHHYRTSLAKFLTLLTVVIFLAGGFTGSLVSRISYQPEVFPVSGEIVCAENCHSGANGEYKFCYNQCVSPGKSQAVGCASSCPGTGNYGFCEGDIVNDAECDTYGTDPGGGVVICNDSCRSGPNGDESEKCYTECHPNKEGREHDVYCRGEGGNPVWVTKNEQSNPSCTAVSTPVPSAEPPSPTPTGAGVDTSQCENAEGVCELKNLCDAEPGATIIRGIHCPGTNNVCCKTPTGGETQCEIEGGTCVDFADVCSSAGDVPDPQPKGCTGTAPVCCKQPTAQTTGKISGIVKINNISQTDFDSRNIEITLVLKETQSGEKVELPITTVPQQDYFINDLDAAKTYDLSIKIIENQVMENWSKIDKCTGSASFSGSCYDIQPDGEVNFTVDVPPESSSETTGKISGNVTVTGNKNDVNYIRIYAFSSQDGITETTEQTTHLSKDGGSYSLPDINLKADTKYYVTAYAIGMDGVGIGTETVSSCTGNKGTFSVFKTCELTTFPGQAQADFNIDVPIEASTDTTGSIIAKVTVTGATNRISRIRADLYEYEGDLNNLKYTKKWRKFDGPFDGTTDSSLKFDDLDKSKSYFITAYAKKMTPLLYYIKFDANITTKCPGGESKTIEGLNGCFFESLASDKTADFTIDIPHTNLSFCKGKSGYNIDIKTGKCYYCGLLSKEKDISECTGSSGSTSGGYTSVDYSEAGQALSNGEMTSAEFSDWLGKACEWSFPGLKTSGCQLDQNNQCIPPPNCVSETSSSI